MTDIPLNLGLTGFAILAAGLFLAAFARGYSGFGFSALLVASGSLVTDPINVVPLAIVLEVAASMIQAPGAWKQIDWKRVGLLCAGALVGNPLGVALLTYLSSGSLRIAIAVFILSASVVLLCGWHFTRRTGNAGTALVGLASGSANGATALGGLPVALFFVAGREQPAVMRANLVAFFFITDIYASGLLATQGILNLNTLHAALWALPFLVAGLAAGSRSFIGTSPEAFRRFVLVLLIGLSILVLAKSAGMV
jgi:hypothetical protein